MTNKYLDALGDKPKEGAGNGSWDIWARRNDESLLEALAQAAKIGGGDE